MLDSLRMPTGRIAFGLVATAVLVALTLLLEPGLVPILPVLLVPIWIPLVDADRMLAGTFVLGLIAFV